MVTLFSETFETATPGSFQTAVGAFTFVSGATETFSDGFGDFFVVTNGTSDIGVFVEYSNADGQFLTTMDADGEGASLPIVIETLDIDISGITNLMLSVDAAEDDDGSQEDWDAGDFVHISARIDDGDYFDILNFESTDAGLANQEPAVDTDFDGVGDGQTLTDAFSTFTAGITGTGALLDLRIEFFLGASNEDIAIDNITVTGDAAAPTFDLQVTEIWPGQDGDDVTEDWFEVTNVGTGAWSAATDAPLFYDDESADPVAADLINGLTGLAAGASAVVVIGQATDATAFEAVWSPVIDLSGVEVGWTDGSGLGQGGDAVTLFLGDPTSTGTIIDSEAYPDTAGNSGRSYDVDLAAFSKDGVGGAVSTLATGGISGTEVAVGSPGNGAALALPTLLSIAALDAVKPEGDAGVTTYTFEVTRTGDVAGATDVDFAVTSAAADAADFGGALPSGTVSFAATDTTAVISIDVTGDAAVEPDEAFAVTLSNPTGGATIDTASANGLIVNDDVAAGAAVIAEALDSDTNGGDSKLLSFTANPDNSGSNGAFAGSAFDVFGITDRTVNFDFADDSAGTFSADDFGILRTGDIAPVFGVEDLDNGDNPGGTGTATWTFDIAGQVLRNVTIDFAAMGDFEAGDNSHQITASIDGGAEILLFDVDTDEDSDLTYTLESGTQVTLNDPLTVNGQTISNDFSTISSNALDGLAGSTLAITLTSGENNGGSEVFAFRDIEVFGEEDTVEPDPDTVPVAQNALKAESIGSFVSANGAEIVAFNVLTQEAYLTSAAGVEVIDFSSPDTPVFSSLNDPAVTVGNGAGSDVTSVDTNGTIYAAALSQGTTTGLGAVGIFNAQTQALEAVVDTGAGPDAIAFSPDGTFIAVAGEGESAGEDNEPGILPNPDGSVTIIDISGGASSPVVTTFDFTDASITFDSLEAKGVRVDRDAPSAAADLEPEFITFDGFSLFVTLQENNAVAVIDDVRTFTGFSIDDITPMGTKDFGIPKNQIDPSNEDGGFNLDTYDVSGLFMPDAVAAYTVEGVTYFVTANEGDSREVDESRGADLVDGDPANGEIDIAEVSATLQTQLADDALLGRLNFSNIDGDTDDDGLIEELFAFGGRSFSIYTADGTQVFDSGNDLDQLANALGLYPDNRSDDKGSEPEGVELGVIDGRTYAFIGLERADSVAVYDVTDPTAPTFDQILSFDGDDAPEGLEFVSAVDSPTGNALLLIANEDSSNIRVVEFNNFTRLISEVQGAGDASTLDGEVVTIEAIVVGDFQNGDGDTKRDLRGFYLQEEDADADENPLTSEGIFVFEGGDTLTDVNVGDRVRVTGTVDEFFGETQIDTITEITVISTDNALPTAATITLPTAGTTTNQNGDLQPDLEAFEGMRVQFSDTLTITEMFQLDRFNEIKLIQGDRPQQFTQTNVPDVAGFAAFQEDIGSRTITYDDGLQVQNAPIGTLDGFADPFTTANAPRMGDTIEDLSGILNYQWAGNGASGATWRVIATEEGENTFTSANPRTAMPDDVGGTLTVASFNVQNFFTTIDTNVGNFNGPNVTGPGQNQEPRGAEAITTVPGATEFERQLEKLVTTITAIDADILGLVEIENDPGGDVSLSTLVDALNLAAGADTYSFVDTGPILNVEGGARDGDAIKVGFVYKPSEVTLTGGFEILDSSDDPRFNSDVQRPSLAQTFTDKESGETFTAVVSHFRAKSSALPGEEDQGDGQGTNNATRLAAAQALVDWVGTDPTNSGDEDFLLLGDFNAYAMEDPIRAILDGADDTRGTADDFTDLAQSILGTDTYNFVFDGLTGTLDYIFASAGLLADVSGITNWNINADEADALDYNLNFGRDPNIFDGSVPFRSSDHDPIIVGLDFGADINEIVGTEFNDTLIGTDGDDLIRGLGGSDLILGDPEDDTIMGGAGFDTLRGFAGNDEIFGGDQADRINGNEGDDLLSGEEGRDSLRGGDGEDTLDGGEGDDDLQGLQGDDLLTDLIGNNRFKGGADNDTIEAGDGVDTIRGGTGDDVVVSGAGNDSITTEDGNDSVDAGAGDDNVNTGEGDDTLFGREGDDRLEAAQGDDFVDGGEGDDSVLGKAGNDTLFAGAGDDRANGGTGDDLIFLGEGNDFVRAGIGNDTIMVDAGNATLEGGFGDDLFEITPDAGALIFRDFDRFNGDDRIKVSGFGEPFDTPEEVVTAATEGTRGDVVVVLGGTTQLTFEGLFIENFTIDDVLIG